MPDPQLLQSFPTPSNPGDAPFVIEHVAEEFTSLCPVTGHPDYGTITLRYQPRPPSVKDRKRTMTDLRGARGSTGPGGCVELKSLKMYYQSFRNEGIFYEAVTNRIRDDLVALMKPAWLQIVTNWKGRGGIYSIIRADFGTIPTQFRGR